jgi:hypothetical protein
VQVKRDALAESTQPAVSSAGSGKPAVGGAPGTAPAAVASEAKPAAPADHGAAK